VTLSTVPIGLALHVASPARISVTNAFHLSFK